MQDAIIIEKLNLLNGLFNSIYRSLIKNKTKIPQLKDADIELARANPA